MLFVLAGVLLLLASGCTQEQEPPRSFEYEAGEEGPAGGLIFYVDTAEEFADWDYLEVAPTEIVAKSYWVYYPQDYQDAKGLNLKTEIGTGKTNCDAFHDAFEDSFEFLPLAVRSLEYTTIVGETTYDDWFLPSADELGALASYWVEHESHLILPDGFVSLRETSNDTETDMWWSSSIAPIEGQAFCYFIEDADSVGAPYTRDYDEDYNARAIRSF